MGYKPDLENQPSPPLDNYDNASETSAPLQEIAGLETRAPADPAADGPGIYPWDTVDEQGRAVRRVPRRRDANPAVTSGTEAGAASTYNAGYSDRRA